MKRRIVTWLDSDWETRLHIGHVLWGVGIGLGFSKALGEVPHPWPMIVLIMAAAMGLMIADYSNRK